MLRAPAIVAAVLLAACGRGEPRKPQAGAGETLRALSSIERLVDAGKSDEALRAAEALARTATDDAMVFEMLGRARIAAQRPATEVADAYAAAASLAPDSPGLQGAAGMMAMQAGRRPQAIELLARAEALEPGNPQHAVLRARLLLDLGDAPGALAAAERARTLAPLDATVALCAARCRLATGDAAGCLELARRPLRGATLSVEARVEAAELLTAAGRPGEAVEAIASVAARPDAPAALLEALARSQAAAGRPREAAETCIRLASAASQPWKPCLDAASNLIDAHDDAAALEWIARARERRAPPGEVERVEARRRPTAAVSGSSDPRPRE